MICLWHLETCGALLVNVSLAAHIVLWSALYVKLQSWEYKRCTITGLGLAWADRIQTADLCHCPHHWKCTKQCLPESARQPTQQIMRVQTERHISPALAIKKLTYQLACSCTRNNHDHWWWHKTKAAFLIPESHACSVKRLIRGSGMWCKWGFPLN